MSICITDSSQLQHRSLVLWNGEHEAQGPLGFSLSWRRDTQALSGWPLDPGSPPEVEDVWHDC